MTDAQLITIAIAVIVPVSLLIYSNSRISDAKEVLRAEIAQLRIEIVRQFENLDAKLKIHELEHHPK